VTEARRDVLCHQCLGEGCSECIEGFVTAEKEDNEIDEKPYKNLLSGGAFNDYVWFTKYNELPDPGTWKDQKAKFIKVIRWCDMVTARWREMMEERKKAAQKLSQMLG
jgi:hypothetical protein